jgi:glutathione S-transferase
MGKLELYQFGPLANQESASPFCVKVRYAMRYKRLAFDTINATSPLQVRRLNRRFKLPVLIDDGIKIVESTNIVRHLESRHPEPRLYPQKPRERAMALLFEDWADESLYWHVVYERWQVKEQFNKFGEIVFAPVPASIRPVVKILFAKQTRRQLRGQGLGRLKVDEQRERFCSALDWLDPLVEGQFLAGPEITIADIAAAVQVDALNLPITPLAQAEIHAHAKVMKWLDRTLEAIG